MCHRKTKNPRRGAQDLDRFLQAFVLLNVYREVGRALMVNASYYLTVADIAGSGLSVNRDSALLTICVFQVFMAVVFRLEMSNFSDKRVALAVFVLQGVLEVALRLTGPQRDEWTKDATRRCLLSSSGRGGRRGTRLVFSEPVHGDPQAGAISKASSELPNSPHSHVLALARPPRAAPQSRVAERLAGTAQERLLVMRQFHARVLLVDMWAEYVGMFMGSMALALSQHYVLYRPFRPYRKYPELFDGDSVRFFTDLAEGLAVQVGIEILTDAICVFFLRRRGMDACAAWSRLPLLTLTPLIGFGMLFASYSGQYRSLFADNLALCNHQDMCACVGHGLLPGGVRESYCAIIYPNISSTLDDTTRLLLLL